MMEITSQLSPVISPRRNVIAGVYGCRVRADVTQLCRLCDRFEFERGAIPCAVFFVSLKLSFMVAVAWRASWIAAV